MRTEGAAPRDVEWVCDDPAYRVQFWRQPAPDTTDDAQWDCDEHRLAGVADVTEVIAWADQRVPSDGQYVVYVEQTDAGSPGLVRLAGFDPTARMFRETSA